MKCRHCGSELKLPLVDLDSAPPSNAYLTEQTLHAPEKWFPLRVLVCEHCWLAQTEDFAQTNELFDADYAYFSSYTSSWLAHSERYVADMVARFNLTADNYVVEVAANDGYLLQYVKARNIPCIGVEPTAGTAAVARAKGIPIVSDFFGVRLAKELVTQGKQADLTAANNVLAHVPDINDFTRGLKAALKLNGTITLEFPHLMRLIEHSQFDTVYHEHFSYLSLYTVERIFNAEGLRIYDVEQLSTHGGSLRIYGCHTDDTRTTTQAVNILLVEEAQCGLQNLDTYNIFQTISKLMISIVVLQFLPTRTKE